MGLNDGLPDYSHLEDLLDFITTLEGIRFALVYDTRTSALYMGNTVSFDQQTRERIREFIEGIITTSQRIFTKFGCPDGFEEYEIFYPPQVYGKIYKVFPLYFVLFATNWGNWRNRRNSVFHTIFPLVKGTLLTLTDDRGKTNV